MDEAIPSLNEVFTSANESCRAECKSQLWREGTRRTPDSLKIHGEIYTLYTHGRIAYPHAHANTRTHISYPLPRLPVPSPTENSVLPKGLPSFFSFLFLNSEFHCMCHENSQTTSHVMCHLALPDITA